LFHEFKLKINEKLEKLKVNQASEEESNANGNSPSGKGKNSQKDSHPEKDNTPSKNGEDGTGSKQKGNGKHRDNGRLGENVEQKVGGHNTPLRPSPKPSPKPSDPDTSHINDQEKDYQSISKATKLLVDVKDVRDELNILSYLLAQQKTVWEKLLGVSVNDDGSIEWDDPASALKLRKEIEMWKGPGYANKEVVEMDKIAQRIQESVCISVSTLILPTNSIR
jgi:hypothetical protein